MTGILTEVEGVCTVHLVVLTRSDQLLVVLKENFLTKKLS